MIWHTSIRIHGVPLQAGDTLVDGLGSMRSNIQ